MAFPPADCVKRGRAYADLVPVEPGSGEVAHKRESGEQPADRERDREQDVERGESELAALVVQRDVEREGRERGVAAQNAGGEEQPPVLRGVAFEGEIGREQAHRERPGDVLEQRRKREGGAEQAREGEVDAVAQRPARRRGRQSESPSPSLFGYGQQKAASRRPGQSPTAN